MGALAWMFAEWFFSKRPTVLGIASGVVAGLVAITPAAGFVNLQASLIIGLEGRGAGIFQCIKAEVETGDTMILWMHSVYTACAASGGHWPRVFSLQPAISGASGLIYGNPKQVWIQFVSIVATIAFTAVGTLIVVYITKFATNGLRVEMEQEVEGLDSALHGERAFEIG